MCCPRYVTYLGTVEEGELLICSEHGKYVLRKDNTAIWI